MRMRILVATLALSFSAATFAGAQDELIIYPSKGQSPQQMEQDKYECYTWAKQQTGFDPMQAQQASQNQGPTGEVVKGAAVGALGGLAIGSIAGDAGKGAAIGAVGGGLIGGIRKKQKQEKQASAAAAGRNEYNRAFGACLEGRGYTVK